MSKVIVSGFIRVPLESLEELRPAIAEHVRLSLEEPGCLTFQLTEDPAEPGRFELYEEFIDMNAFEAHKERAANSRWNQVSQDVERNFEVTTT